MSAESLAEPAVLFGTQTVMAMTIQSSPALPGLTISLQPAVMRMVEVQE